MPDDLPRDLVEIKRADTSLPILPILAERWSPRAWQDRPVEEAGEISKPAGSIHRPSDNRVIEPVSGADIAIGHLADMQGALDLKRRL